MNFGRVNPAQTLDAQGITGLGEVHYNLIEPALVEAAVTRGEGRLGRGGAFLCSTGAFTGRSPKDKFVVRTPSVEDTIWWENNAPMDPAAFDRLHADMLEHMKGRTYFVQDLFAGADPELRLDVRMVTEARLARPLHPPHAAPPRARRASTASCPTGRSSTAPPSRPIRPATAAAPTR